MRNLWPPRGRARWFLFRLPAFARAFQLLHEILAQPLKLLKLVRCSLIAGFRAFDLPARLALPRAQDLQPILIAQSTVANDVARIAVITAWVKFGILHKFDSLHCRRPSVQ